MITTEKQGQGYLDSLTVTLWAIGQQGCDLFGMDLIEVEVNRGRGRLLVRLYIDREQGVTVDDCARVSRAVERLLDAKDSIQGAYTLEVSSPGLDRPIRKEEDFIKFRDREIRVKTEIPIDGRTHFSGILLGISDGSVIVLGEQNEEFRIPHRSIKKARLVYRQNP